jgi:hypothetical protein
LRFCRIICLALCLTVTVPVRPVQAATGGPAPIVVEDPQFGEALFYFYREDYFPAIIRLLAAKRQGQLEHNAGDAELLLGGLYLSYGQHIDAAAIFEELLADNIDPDIRDRTWFFLAKIRHQRGYLSEAQAALDNLSDRLPDNLRREAQMLRAQMLIDDGRYAQAIALLQSWDGETEWASYARFNLGVALVRIGDIDAASLILDELGNLNPFNEELAALRDKANLALGYALLQDGQPFAAKTPLQRVRLEGPFSNKALLGVGWADAELGNYRRALVPWMELRHRDLLDSAVQESMLAIPYALSQLDSIGQAVDHYLNAIEAYYEETNRIDRAIGFIESGDFFDDLLADEPLDSAGWFWRLEELPEGPEARYLYHLLATNEFQEGLKNFRDLDYLRRNLDTWQQNIDIFANMLATRRQAYDERLPRVEDALARADIESLIARKLEYEETLDGIEQRNDWLALASDQEFEMWGEITGLEQTAALAADIPEAEEVRNKIRLLKGVLQWQIEREFKARQWSARRDLQQGGEALVETQRSRRKIEEIKRDEPLYFDSLMQRVESLAPRVDNMQGRVAGAMALQLGHLQSIAVGELRVQKQRLDSYTAQARFALAAIYDSAAPVGEASR